MNGRIFFFFILGFPFKKCTLTLLEFQAHDVFLSVTGQPTFTWLLGSYCTNFNLVIFCPDQSFYSVVLFRWNTQKDLFCNCYNNLESPGLECCYGSTFSCPCTFLHAQPLLLDAELLPFWCFRIMANFKVNSNCRWVIKVLIDTVPYNETQLFGTFFINIHFHKS